MKMRLLLLSMLAGALVLTACKKDNGGDTPPPAPSGQYEGLVLNEICGQQIPDNDWIEILNTSAKAIDISGVQLQKTDENGISEIFYTFPNDKTIASGEYIVLNQLNGDFAVGISNDKQVAIAMLSPVGTTIDDFNRNSDIGADGRHELNGSYARIPNGVGKWSVAQVGTPGDINKDEDPSGPTDPEDDYTGIILNEICGGSVIDEADDWIEILNTTEASVNLTGVQILKTDETNVTEKIYIAPEGTTLAAGEYLVLRKATGELSAKISNTKPVTITLKSPSGEIVIDKFEQAVDIEEGSGIWNETQDNGQRGHELKGSYARMPNAIGPWKVTTMATPGLSNESDETDPVDYTYLIENLVLNELNGNDPKYIELYNKSDEALDISGVIIRKDDKSPVVYVAPKGTTIPAKGFLTLLSDQTSYETGFTSGLSAKKSLKIELLTPDGTTIDVFKNLTNDGREAWGETPKYNGETNGQSYGRYPDGTGEWFMMTPTQNGDNAEGVGSDKIEW